MISSLKAGGAHGQGPPSVVRISSFSIRAWDLRQDPYQRQYELGPREEKRAMPFSVLRSSRNSLSRHVLDSPLPLLRMLDPRTSGIHAEAVFGSSLPKDATNTSSTMSQRVDNPFLVFLHRLYSPRNFQPSVMALEPPRSKSHLGNSQDTSMSATKYNDVLPMLRERFKSGIHFQAVPESSKLQQRKFQAPWNEPTPNATSALSIPEVVFRKLPSEAKMKEWASRMPLLEVSFDNQVLEYDGTRLPAASRCGGALCSLVAVAAVTAVITILLLLSIGTVSYLLVDCIDTDSLLPLTRRCPAHGVSILVGKLVPGKRGRMLTQASCSYV